MGGIHARAFDRPDETLPVEKASADRVAVGGISVWKLVFEPGWRYTQHMEEDQCTMPHAAYIVSGRLRVVMEDGTAAEGGPDTVIVIAPGHDAWTVGDEPCVFIDFSESVDWERLPG
jgi:quercetin dioxygenase-like cupin family protein